MSQKRRHQNMAKDNAPLKPSEDPRGSSTRSNKETVNMFSASSAAVHAVERADVSRGDTNESALDRSTPERAKNLWTIDGEGDGGCRLDVIESMELTVNPVTRIASEYSERMNCTVAVNDDFVSYGLKQGHIRVLHRYSSARALLKGHVGAIACMSFLSNTILAAGGLDGRLFVWRVCATEDEHALEVEMLMSAVFSPGCETSAVMVSPVVLSSDGEDDASPSMVVAVGNAVMVLRVSSVAGDVDIDPLDPAPYGKRLVDFPLQDEPVSISTSLDGALAVGSKRGRVYVCDLKREGDEVVAGKLTPMTIGEEVNGADWVSHSVLMVSTQEGRCKRLYCYSEHDGLCFSDELLLSQESGSPPFIHTSCLLEHNIVCLADTRNKNVYVMMFKGLKSSHPSFSAIAKFSVGQAILSMTTCWNQDTAEEGKGGVELNCVQTDAVQQYYIDLDLFTSEEHLNDVVPVDTSAKSDDHIGEDGNESKEEDDEEETQDVLQLEKLNLEDSCDNMDAGMMSGRLLTPSDIISSAEKGKTSSPKETGTQIKILKRGEKIKPAQKAVEVDNESSDEESDEESAGLQSVPLALLEDSSASSLYTMMVRLIKENSSKQSTMMKNAFKDQRKYVDDQMSKMTKNLDKKITSQVKSEMKAMQSNLNNAIQTAAKESIRTILPKEVMGAVKTSLDKQLSGAVQQGLNKSIQDSFKQSFTKQIVPAFESACQTMFRQIDESLRRELKEHMDVSRNAFEQPMQLAQTLQKTLDSAQVLAENIGTSSHQLTGEVALSSSTSGIRSPKIQDPKEELQSLIRAGQYNDAFSKVLSLQDLSILSWLCSIVDAPSTLSISPPALSQMVLLSLLQQLSADLNHGTTSKLQWIREAAMAINPADQSIKGHIKPVLEQVAHALHTSLPRLAPADASSCKLTLHVVRSQMQA